MIPELKVPYLHEKQVERAANELLHKYAKEKFCSCRGEACRKRRAQAIAWRRALVVLFVASIAATSLVVLNLLSGAP